MSHALLPTLLTHMRHETHKRHATDTHKRHGTRHIQTTEGDTRQRTEEDEQKQTHTHTHTHKRAEAERDTRV